MPKVFIVGIGPGTDDYLLPVAKRVVEDADCLIGARRHLKLFHVLGKEEIPLEGDLEKVLSYLQKERHRKKIAVLVSGDPGLYSFLGRVSRFLKKEEYSVIPGISTVQIAFARLGEEWEDATILSLHGREIGDLGQKVKGASKVFIFTDPNVPPEKIAAILLEQGVGNRRVIVMENLAYPDERIIETDLIHLREMKGFGLNVMILRKEEADRPERDRISLPFDQGRKDTSLGGETQIDKNPS